MSRPTKPPIQVNGRAVQGVWKSERGFYILNRFKQGDKREFVPTVDKAIQRRDELAGIKPTIPVRTLEQDREAALSAGIDEDYLDAHPEVVRAFWGGVKINPAYPDFDLAVKLMMGLPTSPDNGNDSPKGLRLADVGKTYLTWYADDRENVKELKDKARAYNALQTTREANGLTAKEKRRTSPRRKRWIDFASRSTRCQYHAADGYFRQFVSIVGNKPVDRLQGSDFTTYATTIRQLARDNGNDVKAYSGSRFRNVVAAFNRAFRVRPDDFPNVATLREYLRILETRSENPNANNASKNGHKPTARSEGRLSPAETITPAEFGALLKVACPQWRALLLLAVNGCLKNSDVAEIRWRHIDFTEATMFFPRPKNGRLRQTPLAPEVMDALTTWRSESLRTKPNDLIFLTPDGTPWITSTDSVVKHFNILKIRVKNETGVVIESTFQALRKAPATAVRAAKIEQWESAIEMLLGHASPKSWRHYVGSFPDYLKDAVDVIRRKFMQ
ncbi:hypothetical protein C4585_01510 [Candidatus Parcubacteria bacterium]|nr:MAG: hypothetical protein C4585_01510 [Candidatus Parcubacteria bacterium]